MNYYNEIDKKVAAWLRELIKRDLIAPGEVDERSIEDVVPSDLKGFTQCHFFAGIGGWSYALRLAGWPDDKPVWTGSCPCQPFSSAGKGAGFADERHLWPAWFHLIKQCNPARIYGEQVASKNTNPWFDLVQADLEGMGYAFGCIAFPSAGIGSPHIRDRAYWMGDSESQRRGETRGLSARPTQRLTNASAISGLADADLRGRQPQPHPECTGVQPAAHGATATREQSCHDGSSVPSGPGPTNGFWRDADWLLCRDGKWRPVESGTFPLADGAAARVVRLRGYGNAINPYAAKAFIEATQEALTDLLIVFGVDSLAFQSSAKRVDRLIARMKGRGE